MSMARHTRIDLRMVLLAASWMVTIASVCEAGDHVVVTTGDSNRYSTSEEEDFAQQDRNGDGVISPSEWFRSRAEFYRLDYNRDGVLTRNEFLGGGQRTFSSAYGPRDAFSAMDFDRNGVLSPNEWRSSPSDFYRLDYNRDGILNRSEFFGREEAMYPASGGRSTFAQYDRDGDGMISRFEWPSDSISFDQLDRDRNGVLSSEEIENRQSQDVGGQALQSILEGLFRKQ